MSDDPGRKRLLILGGTGDAARLAEAATARFGDRLQVVSSIAGRTDNPRLPPGETRQGGFGGAEGLATYLDDHHIDLMIDATHPFAARITANAAAAIATSPRPWLQLRRPGWIAGADDNWYPVDSPFEAALQAAVLGSRWFVTVGAQELRPFLGHHDIHVIARMITVAPEIENRPGLEIIRSRGPFDLAGERALLSGHAVDVLVTKNSGGIATEAKLSAARELGLPVVMINRPAAPEGPGVESVSQAVEWLAGQMQQGKTE